MPTLDDVRSLAFQLSPQDRAALAHQLIVSLDEDESDPDAEQAWAEEIERRASAYERGETTAVDWEESLRELRHSLARRRSE